MKILNVQEIIILGGWGHNRVHPNTKLALFTNIDEYNSLIITLWWYIHLNINRSLCNYANGSTIFYDK
jgi:hypothetical protein